MFDEVPPTWSGISAEARQYPIREADEHRDLRVIAVQPAAPGSEDGHEVLVLIPDHERAFGTEDGRAARVTRRTVTRLPGLRYTDHVAFTVPDLDAGVEFFVDVLGAEELYRSTRGPDAQFMPENFAVPADASLTLAMLRLPPNLNVELFQWRVSDRRETAPRHSDAGGHHLCFVVDDVDAAITALRGIPGVRVLGDRKEVMGDSPRVAGNRWTYFVTPWGLLMEIVDRSRVLDVPRLVGPAEWSTIIHDGTREDQ